jgi:signal transduction histidine kinase
LADDSHQHGTAPPPAGGTGADDALSRCQAQLAALLRQQELLAYGISHDLRAPLRAIDNYAALLQRQFGERLDDPGREHLQRIRDAGRRMGALIGSLLELSRGERGELDLAPVDLSLLAELVLAELQEADPERALHARVEPGLRVHGDAEQLRSLLLQLLRNAWNFSDGPVHVEVAGARMGGQLRVSVHDRGRGFDMRYAAKLYEPFQRLHGADEGAGSGLGLAIANRIVERHGGRLWAHSEPGAGSTFFVELPAATDPTESPG